jgi:hypothetical protein
VRVFSVLFVFRLYEQWHPSSAPVDFLESPERNMLRRACGHLGKLYIVMSTDLFASRIRFICRIDALRPAETFSAALRSCAVISEASQG